MKRNSHGQGQGPRSSKKPRKQRPCYSCDECRRLKMKCDRQIVFPCSNCVRRQRATLCNAQDTAPSRSLSHNEPVSTGATAATVPVDIPQPQSPPLSSSRHVADVEGSSPPRRHQDVQGETGHSPAGSTQAATRDRASETTSVQRSPETRGELMHLALLDRALALQQSSSHSSPSSIQPIAAERTIPHGVSSSGALHADAEDEGGSYGTLVITRGGRSEYLGPTAGSEWLKDSETQELFDSAPATRPSSPKLPAAPTYSHGGQTAATPIAFPFNESSARISTRDLLAQLLPKDEAWALAESYYRYCAWHHDVAPKKYFKKTFDRVYSLSEGEAPSPPVNAQEIALVFIMMAQGTMFNIELPHFDPSAEAWLHLSERALVKGDFLSNNMLAGLQTLHLMAHVHIQLDKGHRGESAWPLWGLVMRQVQAMGMHRDGSRWNLPSDVVEERRKVFWEVQAQDTFQAHCFSRPAAINPEHCDTKFPAEPSLNDIGEKNYTILRYQLSQLSSEILNMAMKVRKPPYSDVVDLDFRLCEFERSLPFALRSRAALLSMPSRYPRDDDAINASPDPSPRSMTLSFQQMNLALNISETVINLHRPYYAKALYNHNHDPVESPYALSYLTVIERCVTLISLVRDIHSRFPAVSTRQWNCWYHVFGSVLCLSTLVFRDARNPLATLVLTQIDVAIGLFTSLIQLGAATPRYHRNLQWLMKLRSRVATKISTATKAGDQYPQAQRENSDGEDGEDVELLGWRTRLIERAGQEQTTIRTIGTTNPVTPSNAAHEKDTPSSQQGVPDVAAQLVPEAYVPPTLETPDSMNDLLQDFWDPMLVQDIFAAPYVQLEQPNPFVTNGTGWWDNGSVQMQ